MKNKFSNLSGLTLAAINAAIVCVFLIVFPTVSLSQTPGDRRGIEPLVVEIKEQTGSPVIITAVSIDISTASYQTVNFVIQNISDKNIKATVLLHGDKAEGATGSATSIYLSFTVGQMMREMVREEGVNTESSSKMFLSIDYVEFEDGSFWGDDSKKMSEHLSGFKEGQKNAAGQIKDLLNDQKALSNFLGQETTEIKPPDASVQESDKWRRGYSTGYKSTFRALQSAYEKQGIEALSAKLKEIEKSIELRKTK